ncbi:zinc finger protein 292b [Alosa sapidissima]|uniref:zinc finger protein 292b n=1 Tax=Alosa sapidissima TaxID=34773 RepID=UPI001C09A4FF|nr:zinc finger protein 292b [Alosa sapidissima]
MLLCAYAAEVGAKMADEEAEQDCSGQSGCSALIGELRGRLEELSAALKDSVDSPLQSATLYCQAFCQTLVEYAGCWRVEENPLPLVEVYATALLSYAQASTFLSTHCENVSLVPERLSLSYLELLLSLPDNVPESLWQLFQASVQSAHDLLQKNGIVQLHMLSCLSRETGVWNNRTLQNILSNEAPDTEKVHAFLALEGPILLEMRIKHLIKENQRSKAALLAKACSECPEFEGKGHFKQMYLVSLCSVAEQKPLMEEISKVDCRDALEMICNLESEGDEKGAFTLCSAFLTCQLLQAETYCAWELTLFWSKLLKRLEASDQGFLDRCRQMSKLSKTVFHILFFIKVIQSEVDAVGLPVCIEMCIKALQMESVDGKTKATICKTISCLLPTDLEVKRACQLTEFLIEPTVDSYYAVETLYNEPDQKLEEENLPVPNSLRCELLLVFKTQWPFDPEFWDWKTLKRHCLALMGEEASIVSSIDELNDDEEPAVENDKDHEEFKDVTECFLDTTNELNEMTDEKQKKREIKKLREKGFVSARFRNWQAYMQYCVLCDKEFLGHRIVRHAQTHFKDGQYSCPICAQTFDTKETLEPHVASHVKLSCKERLASMKTTRKLAKSKTSSPAVVALKCKTSENQERKAKIKHSVNGESLQPYSGDAMDIGENGAAAELSEENVCPLPNCRKGFKYFKNLLIHVKDHGDNDEAKRFLEMHSKKVICQYCRRQFVSVAHLNDHLQVHCGVKPYICIQLYCKASFNSNAELVVHSKEHASFKAKCMFPGCGKIFHEAFMLYDHEAQHYITFTCKDAGCGKIFHSQAQLDEHQEEHVQKVVEKEIIDDHATDQACHSDTTTQQLHDHVNSVGQHQHGDELTQSQDTSQCSTVDDDSLQSPEPLKVKHSVENILRTNFGPISADDPLKIKSEPSDPNHYPLQQVPFPDVPMNHQPIMNAHPSHQNPTRPQESHSGPYMYDQIQSVPNTIMPATPSYHGAVENFQQAPLPDVLQGHPQPFTHQPFPSQVHRPHNPDFRRPVLAPYQNISANHMPTVGHAPNSVAVLPGNLPPTSQALPARMAPQSLNENCTVNQMVHPPGTNGQAQPEVEKERHRCAFESCTRTYSSYRSVTKHMKAVHPDFYVQWKLEKKNNRVSTIVSRGFAANGDSNSLPHSHQQGGHRAPLPPQQMKNALGQPLPYSTPCHSSNGPTVSSHAVPLSGQGQALAAEMDNILNPILLSQLGNSVNQMAPLPASHIDTPWHAAQPDNVSHQPQNHCTSQVLMSGLHGVHNNAYPSHLDTAGPSQRTDSHHQNMDRYSLQPHERLPSTHMPPQVAVRQQLIDNKSGEGFHSINGQCFSGNRSVPLDAVSHVTQSNMERVNNSLIPSNLSTDSGPFLSSYRESLNNPVLTEHQRVSVATYAQQPQTNSLSNVKPEERVLETQDKTMPDSHLHGHSNPHGRTEKDSQEGSDNGDTKRKRNKRTKWPAIIRDGKFICCRCFREFQSPKSLGGHLSKRSHCKAFDETDLTADLPSSFLDLLNSPHIMNSPQVAESPQYNINFKDSSFEPIPKGPLDPKLFPNVSFPQANSNSYSNNGDQNGEVFKQVLDHSAAPGLYETPVQQQAFQNPCGSYASDGLMLDNTVIQHTGNNQLKTECQPHGENYLQSSDSLFGDELSDPLLTQFLSENQSLSSLNSLPTDQINQILRAETLMKMKEIKDKATIPNASGLSSDGLLSVMANLAQNLMSDPLQLINSSDSQPSSTTVTALCTDPQKDRTEHDVKKRLREQILSGEIHRRNSNSQTPSVESSSSSRPSSASNHAKGINPVAQPLSGSQMTFHNQEKLEVDQKRMTSATVPPVNTTTPLQSCPQLVGVIQTHGVPAAQSVVTEADSKQCPPPSEGPVDVMFDIQRCFERMDLDREDSHTSDPVESKSSIEPVGNNQILNSLDSNVIAGGDKGLHVPSDFQKPFACDVTDCLYKAMTKDALFKHFSKNHNYTEEMLNQVKKSLKFAPFSCQLCSKTFTRNSNLRAHCQVAHSLSQAEMIKLKIKRQYNKRMESADLPTSPPIQNPSTLGPGYQQQSNCQSVLNPLAELEKIKPECLSAPFAHATASSTMLDRIQNKIVPAGSHLAQQITVNQTVTQAVLKSEPTFTGQFSGNHIKMEQQSAGEQIPSHSQLLPGLPGIGTLPASPNLGQVPCSLAPPVASCAAQSPEKKPKPAKARVTKPRTDTPKKAKERKPEADDVFSPYRPYRCVHQGCVAAFTIQQNLILHYRAVHQSSLPQFEINNEGEDDQEQAEEKHEQEDEEPEGEVTPVTEFRCQVKDCSRIFQEVTSLLQHYLQLHKFKLDKAGAFLSSINLGRFQCDQPGCTTYFTAFWKYIAHIDKDHKEAKMPKAEAVEGMFRCDVEGCDCVYTTRSNLLRHTMKKHQDLYKLQLMNQRKIDERVKPISRKPQYSDSDGKENIENNKKVTQKGNDKKRKDSQENHWTKYGKPSLKGKDEAAAMCTKRFPLQYPCMIKGCESVMSSERNALRHYVKHGLSEKYLEEQRSHFIFCKKIPLSRFRRSSTRSEDSEESEDCFAESSDNEDTGPDATGSEFSKLTSEKESTEDPEFSDAKMTTDGSDSSVVVKRKRGRPRKTERRHIPERRSSGRLRTRNRSVNYADNGSDSNISSPAPANEDNADVAAISSFKPMGFEVSFLQFLEKSSGSPKRRASDDSLSDLPLKRTSSIHLKNATVLCKRADPSTYYYKNIQSYAEFRNPEKLASLGNVTFAIDKSFAGVTDLLLKQLHEMRPTVILHK